MPTYYQDLSDERGKALCIHCGRAIWDAAANRDHVPSKSFLVVPYPSDLCVTTVCKQCNDSFSSDEEYMAAFLSCVLTGTTVPEEQKLEIGKRILLRNPSLKARIETQRKEHHSLSGQVDIIWEPELARIERVVIKNARGHVFYENGVPIINEPSHVEIVPLQTLSTENQDEFLGRNVSDAFWPEVGSRGMQRMVKESDIYQDGFFTVQPNVYRFKLVIDGGIGIRSILHEYLACTVYWQEYL